MRAPEVGLPLLGGPRRPQRKRAHTSLSRLREEVKRRGPPAPGCRAVRDSTLVAWYRPLYAPRTGGAYDSHRWTTGIAGRTRRRGGRVAAGRPCAAAGGTGDRHDPFWIVGNRTWIADDRLPPGPE